MLDNFNVLRALGFALAAGGAVGRFAGFAGEHSVMRTVPRQIQINRVVVEQM